MSERAGRRGRNSVIQRERERGRGWKSRRKRRKRGEGGGGRAGGQEQERKRERVREGGKGGRNINPYRNRDSPHILRRPPNLLTSISQ